MNPLSTVYEIIKSNYLWLHLELKMGQISRINLAGNIEVGGAKMLYLPLVAISLQWKHLFNFVDDYYVSLW